ncbi:hypothetical protein [Chromobacterium vaccinii]|uniref:hypothetical protein n=1 Tax=Chromobacterium vaccinii TaxID=1108595 RepID=UPI000617ED39|nr:hypothetical protein [Chromobacterium vaccinii]
MKFGNAVKVLLGILGTILLGAIGSGFWERVLSPFLGYLSSALTSTLSDASKTYSNSIYTTAANLFTPNSTEGLGVVLLLLVFSWLFLNAVSSKKESRFIEILHRAMTMQFKGWFGIAYCGAMLIFLFFMMARQATVEKIQSYSYQKMEIARPFIGEQKYLMLRSRYLQIKTKEDFDRFLVDLYTTSKSGGLAVEPFVLK